MIAPGRLPVRDPQNAVAGRAPVPGWDARYDWKGAVPFDELVDLIARWRFFGWEEEYEPSGTCQPPYTLSVTTDRRRKRVRVWGGSPMPTGFDQIASRVDAIAEAIAWSREAAVTSD